LEQWLEKNKHEDDSESKDDSKTSKKEMVLTKTQEVK
jgi:hypothetical protein